MKYSYTKKSNLDFSTAENKVRQTLTEAGFGILTEIDVKKTMKEKLDIEFEDYKILGACNPPFAHKALLAEKEIGLLLPCNVLVYKNEDAVYVSAVLPTTALEITGNKALQAIAEKVEKRLKRAIDSVE